MRWMLFGPDALLVYFADTLGEETFARGTAIAAELEAHPPAGLLEFVSGFTSVLLEFDRRIVPDPRAIAAPLLGQLTRAALRKNTPAAIKEIPIRYDGPDLARVANQRGLSTAEVRALHSGTVYKVYMLGFAPGFPYLGDLDPRLHTPRLPTPRPRIPPGSVGIGGAHTGIYPVETAAGWNIIGHTNRALFDLTRARQGDDEAMFFLRQGDRVQFVPI